MSLRKEKNEEEKLKICFHSLIPKRLAVLLFNFRMNNLNAGGQKSSALLVFLSWNTSKIEKSFKKKEKMFMHTSKTFLSHTLCSKLQCWHFRILDILAAQHTLEIYRGEKYFAMMIEPH